MRERDLGNAVAVDVVGGGVDRLVDAGDQDMFLPARILVPPKLLEAAGQRDDVGLAVTVQIGDNDLVAAGEAGVNRVRGEARGGWLAGRLRGRLRERCVSRQDDRGDQSREQSRTDPPAFSANDRWW